MSLRAPCAEGGEESQIELNRPITHNPGSHTPFLLLCQFIALWRAYKIPLKRRRRRRGGKGRERNNSFYSPSGTLLWGEGGGRYGKLTRMDSVCVIRGNDNISSSFVAYTTMGDCCVEVRRMILRETPVITPLRKRVFPRVAICQPARKMRLYGNEIQLLSTISCFATCDNFWALFCFLSFAFAMI